MESDTWVGCYPSRWSDLIVPEAMAHPAKYSSRLIRRIYDHMAAEGWVHAGDTIIDPFGGVALGALDAMRLGLQWEGVELESHFAAFGVRNIERWNVRFGKMPHWGSARLFNGDSRRLCQILGVGIAGAASIGRYADGFDAVVSSPPFLQSSGGGLGGRKGEGPIGPALYARHAAGNGSGKAYGKTNGQLANMSLDDREIENFWGAARQIVEQVYLGMVPGSHAVWVCKDYVKDKQIIPFCDQWRRVCEAVGFRTVHEHHAMLVHNKGTSITLEGEHIDHRVENKSFFRRLVERNGSPKIDYETIYCFEKA